MDATFPHMSVRPSAIISFFFFFGVLCTFFTVFSCSMPLTDFVLNRPNLTSWLVTSYFYTHTCSYCDNDDLGVGFQYRVEFFICICVFRISDQYSLITLFHYCVCYETSQTALVSHVKMEEKPPGL